MIEGSHTLRNERRDFVEWHRGRSPYVLWALDVDQPAVRQRFEAAAAHLADWLLADYCRQPHITLDLCGFPAHPPTAEDEFSLPMLDQAVKASATEFPGPFEIGIGGLNSFSSAPFLSVEDNQGGIAALRHRLTVDGQNRSKNDYVPHVTVGLYRDAWPADAVRQQLKAFNPGNPLSVQIERLTLMAYQPADIGGELDVLGELCLKTQRMVWR